MEKRVALTGNVACANAMRQINPDVVAAYPITPQTAVVEEFSTFVADGKVDTEFVCVESEHSAMSSCIGASAAGARVMTATASQGLALMWEMLYIASSLRLPIVMHNVNRTLSAPINIHCDHQDSMGARDSGWIQLYSEDAQEAYDNTIQAIRIAEDRRVQLPVMVCLDGFIISHAIDRLEIMDDKEVKDFVGERKPSYSLLDTKKPIAVGPFDGLHGYFMEFKKIQRDVIKQSKNVVKEIGKEYGKLAGREYNLLEAYKLDDADTAIMVLGSTAGTVKATVESLRAKGKKVGLLKLRLFRPFPLEEIREALSGVGAVAVLDRADSFGAEGGPLYMETRSAFYDELDRPNLVNYLYGLGGRDIGTDLIEKVYADLDEIVKTGKLAQELTYLGIRE